MLKIEHAEVFGWEAAVRGMRNPMNSWDQSDSRWEFPNDTLLTDHDAQFVIGKRDLDLMKRLARGRGDDRKYLRFIHVQLDIVAPEYWWKEFKTYRIGRKFCDPEYDCVDSAFLEPDVEMNSCSTMHKIHSKAFNLDDFSHEHLSGTSEATLTQTIDTLNMYRNLFNTHKDKEYWWQMIQLLPMSFNYRRTVDLNYEVLRNIHHARKAHKLDEWRIFCAFIESLPHSELITGKGDAA